MATSLIRIFLQLLHHKYAKNHPHFLSYIKLLFNQQKIARAKTEDYFFIKTFSLAKNNFFKLVFKNLKPNIFYVQHNVQRFFKNKYTLTEKEKKIINKDTLRRIII